MADTDLRDRMAAAIRADLQLAVPAWEPLPGVKLSPGMGRTEFDLADAALRVVQAELARIAAERDGAYHERAQLLADLATHYPAVLAPAPDVDEPGWTLLYITLPTGQASWHLHPRDRNLFTHVEPVSANDPRAQWDGHTTEEKYQRLQEAAELSAAERLRRERDACPRCNTGDRDPCGKHLTSTRG